MKCYETCDGLLMTMNYNRHFCGVKVIHIASTMVIVLGLVACAPSLENKMNNPNKTKLIIAELFIDAFYSFDGDALRSYLNRAQTSKSRIVYYQGWAKGGNYRIINRKPCEMQDANTVICAVTVEDDATLALKTNFLVTDTFTISFDHDEIMSVTTSSDDPPIYYEAYNWVKENSPELFDGPCQGFFDGGETPGDCARAMTKGYAEFVKRNTLGES